MEGLEGQPPHQTQRSQILQTFMRLAGWPTGMMQEKQIKLWKDPDFPCSYKYVERLRNNIHQFSSCLWMDYNELVPELIRG